MVNMFSKDNFFKQREEFVVIRYHSMVLSSEKLVPRETVVDDS